MTGKLSGASKAVRFALVATVLLILALLATPLLPAGWTGAWVVGMIGLLVYVPLTPLALRAKLDNQILRYFFGLTALPIFGEIYRADWKELRPGQMYFRLRHAEGAIRALRARRAVAWLCGGVRHPVHRLRRTRAVFGNVVGDGQAVSAVLR